MADGDNLKFSGISHAGKAGVGVFKLTADQLGWKCTEQGVPDSQVQYAGQDVMAAEWLNACGRKRLLKICFKEAGGVSRFAGFEKSHFASLKAHLAKHFNVDLAEVLVSTNGWSWGDVNLEGDNELKLMSDEKIGLEVPLGDLGQVAVRGKTDVVLEMQADGDKADDEVLCEIVFQVVPEKISTDTLQQELQQKAGLSERGEAVGRISDVMLVAPRGKHELEFFRQTMKVHGKTQTYTVKYKSIARLFLLTLPGKTEVVLVVGLDQPLRSGQQLNYFLVFQLNADARMLPNLPPEKMKAYNLNPGESQLTYIIMSKLLKDLSGKVLVAPASDLQTKNGSHSVGCSHKAQRGHLYPMKKSMLFIVKPVVWIRYDEIVSIEFLTGRTRAKSFDILVKLKDKAPVEFSQMEKEDIDALNAFFNTVGIQVVGFQPEKEKKNNFVPLTAAGSVRASKRGAGAVVPAPAPADEDDEDDDEDFDDDGSSSEGSEGDDDADDDSEDDQPKKKRAKK